MKELLFLYCIEISLALLSVMGLALVWTQTHLRSVRIVITVFISLLFVVVVVVKDRWHNHELKKKSRKRGNQ